MALELSELFNDRTIDVPLGQHTMQVTYRPGERTVETFQAHGDDEWLNDTIVRTVKSWDLVDHGQPVPLTAEAVAKIPVPVLRHIIKAIGEDDGLGEAPSSSDAT